MNPRFVLKQLGLLLLVLSACMGVIALLDALFWAEQARELLATEALGMATTVGAAIGGLLWFLGYRSNLDMMGRRDAMLLVATTWLIGAALAALPYYVWAWLLTDPHIFRDYSACYFEAMSGLTTTGATVLGDIEAIPKSLLLWRATTHWLGGLGIVVLFVAVLPTLGVGGKRLFQVEAAGPHQQGVRPRIKETARALWLIYLFLTLVMITTLRVCGLEWFDAVCHTFATLATGGFSTHNASLGQYHAMPWVDLVVVLFMFLAGVNFGLYYQLMRRRFSAVWKDPELRAYTGMVLIGASIVAFSIWQKPLVLTNGETIESANAAEAVRQGLVQVVSIHTGTGFCTVDFNLWDFLPQAVLVVLMFFGACGGSTCGGIKVIRIIVACKVILAEVERVYRPSVVRTIKVGQGTVDDDLKRSVLVYILGIIVLFALGAIALDIFEPRGSLDFTSAATAVIACLMNIGPGLGAVGAVENYGFFSAPSKVLLSLMMILGRLEVYALIVLVYPKFWIQD